MNAPARKAADLLAMHGIVKRFGGVQALRGVDFDLRPGEIHALLGENGAGKSTLMNILSGVIEPDAGEMRIDGAIARFANPRAAQASGVATIFQELDLVPGLDVTANLFLGRELTRAGVLDRPEMRREALTRLEAVGVEIDVDQPVGELSVGRRQIVAIAKALTYASRILVMDEPTAALTAAEVERLFKVMREIAARGVGIVYISHRLEEVPRVADRVTVLRDGQVAGVASARAPQSELVRLLVGRPLAELYPSRSGAFGRRILRLESARYRLRRARAGLAGAARRLARGSRRRNRRTGRHHGGWAHRTAVRALWRRPAPGAGPASSKSTARPRASTRSGTRATRVWGFVTDDRRGSGLMLRDSVGRNLVMSVLRRVSPFFLMSQDARGDAGARGDRALSTCARPCRTIAVGALVGRQPAEGRARQGSARRAAPAAARRADARRRCRREGRDLRPHSRARRPGPRRPHRVERNAGTARSLRPGCRHAGRPHRRGISRRR